MGSSHKETHNITLTPNLLAVSMQVALNRHKKREGSCPTTLHGDVCENNFYEKRLTNYESIILYLNQVKVLFNIRARRLMVRTRKPVCRLFLSKYGVGYGKWTSIDGWSESVIDYIREFEMLTD